MKKFDENWTILEAIPGGAQGDCFKIQAKDSLGKTVFLKRIKDGQSSERRRRFFTEATIFKSLDIQGIPKIIETNASCFRDKKVDLYYISEFAEGERLDSYVKSKSLSEDEVVFYFRQLLAILNHLHIKDIVHRDIKPENIIIKDSQLTLVDFGIAYCPNNNEETKTGQEVGNRFLRLPEHSAGSPNKRDSRSDLTLAAGIALFCFTKKYPRVLIDEDGRAPHQNKNIEKYIRESRFSVQWNIIFDKAFAPNIAKRWAIAEEILEVLNTIEMNHINKDDEFEKILELHAKEIEHNTHEEIAVCLEQVHVFLRFNIYNSLKEKAKSFQLEEQQTVYHTGQLDKKSQIRAHLIGKHNIYLSIEIIARVIGEQIAGIIKVDSDEYETCRISISDKPELPRILPSTANSAILKKLVEIIKEQQAI